MERSPTIIPAAESKGFWIYVVKAKNDRYGRGNRAFLPSISATLGKTHDPFIVVCTYIAAVASWMRWVEQSGVKLEPWSKRHLFPVFKGPRTGAILSDKSIRDDVKKALAEQGHEPELPSFRKGGAEFYSGQDRQIAYAQGGWAAKGMLEMVYAPLGPREHAEKIARAALQQFVDLAVEGYLRRLHVAWENGNLEERAGFIMKQLLRFKIPPSFPSARAVAKTLLSSG